MGAFLAYTVYTSIFLLAGYLLYKLVMAGEKQMSLNRAVLIGIYVLAFAAWPLSRIRWHSAAPAANAAFDFLLLPGGMADGDAAQPVWPLVLIAVYFAGLATTAIFTVITAVRLITIVKSGVHEKRGGHTLVLLPEGRVAPFSWGRYVVMSKDDYDAAGDTVTAHELAHIHCRHCLDLLVAQAVCILLWYNPAAWLMREELKTVHEYQADASVLASGIDPRTYQMLLIKKAVGTRFQSLANSLNHSKLKKRITMMYKEKNSGLRRLRGLVLALAPVAAIAVVNIPALASGLESLRSASLESTEESVKVKAAGTFKKSDVSGKDTQNDGTEQKLDKYAEFPGGEMEMFKFLGMNVRYPEAAMKENRQGRSVVQFTVNADGSISDIKVVNPTYGDLDAEAIRVVESMPAWTPAQKDGKNVASTYDIPVAFKLRGEEKATAGKNAHKFEDIVVIGYSEDTDKCKIKLNNAYLSEPNAPTVTVDGVKVTDIDNLKPDDIESITVMKNEPEYPNGRIIITLKKQK